MIFRLSWWKRGFTSSSKWWLTLTVLDWTQPKKLKQIKKRDFWRQCFSLHLHFLHAKSPSLKETVTRKPGTPNSLNKSKNNWEKKTLFHNEKWVWTVKTSNVMSYGQTGLEHWVSKGSYSFQCHTVASQTNKLEFIWKNTKVVFSEFNKIVPQKRSTTENRSRRLIFTLHAILHLFRYVGISSKIS